MKELLTEIWTDKVKGFLTGIGCAVVYYLYENVMHRLEVLESVIDMLYRAISGGGGLTS